MDKKSIRIAIFIPPMIGWGGGPQFLSKIAAHLSEKHYVEIFTTKFSLKGLNFNKVKLTLIKPLNKYLSPIAYLIKKTKDFDLVILTSFPTNLASITHKPSITICASPTLFLYEKEHFLKKLGLKKKIMLILKNVFLKKLDLLSAKKTTLFLSVSERTKRKVKRFYKRNSRIFYPGIDFDEFKSGRYGNYVLSVSRFVSHKRVDMVIKSMGYVKNKKIKLKVVGCGEEENKIKELCEKYPNVEFLGFVSDKKLKELYANCLALVYVPIDEPEGYAPIEAGASGKATIGANEGGLKETVVNRRTGFLIDNVSPIKIAEKIDFFAENRKIAKEMGKEAKRYTKKFDWENTLGVLDTAIEDVVRD